MKTLAYILTKEELLEDINEIVDILRKTVIDDIESEDWESVIYTVKDMLRLKDSGDLEYLTERWVDFCEHPDKIYDNSNVKLIVFDTGEKTTERYRVISSSIRD